MVSLNREETDPKTGKLDHRTSYYSFSCRCTSDKAPLFCVFFLCFFFNSLAIQKPASIDRGTLNRNACVTSSYNICKN